MPNAINQPQPSNGEPTVGSHPEEPPSAEGRSLPLRRILVLSILAIGVGFWITELGGSSPAIAPESSSRVIAYLELVDTVVAREKESLEQLDAVLKTTYVNRDDWSRQLQTTFAATPSTAAILATLESAEPPEGYEDGHGTWMEVLGDRIALERGMRRALADDDLVDFTMLWLEYQLGLGRVLLAAPLPMCERMSGLVTTLLHEDQVCRDPDGLPGGGYGSELWGAVRRFAVEYFPRAGTPPHFLTGEETRAYLAATQPDVRRVISELLDEITPLRPPAGLEADHQLLVDFLEAQEEIAVEVADAASSGDMARVQALTVRANGLARQFADQLSNSGRDLFVLLLLEAPDG